MPQFREGMPNPEAEKPEISAGSASITSDKHPERNEDAVLGDLKRLESEVDKPPQLETDPNFTKIDQETFQKWAEKEKVASPLLEKLGICGLFDGVSGTTTKAGKEREPNGSGILASRIGSGVISHRLSGLRLDAGAEASAKAIRNAMLEANKTVLTHTTDRPDIDNMASTADIIRLVESEDGGHEMAYGHAGDSRIYILDGQTKELRRITADDGPAAEALHQGMITKEQFDQIMTAQNAAELPDYNNPNIPNAKPAFLRSLFKYRNRAITNSIGADEKTFRVSGGVEKLKKGDKILLSSDGIHDNLNDDQIRAMLISDSSAEDLANQAREHTETDNGKMDDITAQLITV